jgi:WG repeat protein
VIGYVRIQHLAVRAVACAGLVAASACAGAPVAEETAGKGVSAEPRIFPICVRARFGFIDRIGKIIVPPTLGMIDETIGTLTKVWVLDPVPPGEEKTAPRTGRAGFIDTRGRLAVEPIYEDAHPFSEGLAAVKREGKWGYVDGVGRVRIPLRFERANAFSEGLALVGDEAGQRFIDASGRTVVDLARVRWRRGGIELPVQADGSFVDGLAAVRVVLRGETPDVLVGFADRQGRLVIEPAFTYAYGFHGGFASVQVACPGASGGRCQGIIRRDGSWVVPPRDGLVSHLEDGLAGFTERVGPQMLHGFLGERGQVVISPRYEHSCLWFREGLCQTKVGRRWAYVDRSGAEVLVLPPDTTYADQFSEGIAKVQAGPAVRYVLRDGRAAFEGTFKDGGRFRDGLASVQFLNGGSGYVDREGRVVYRQAEPCFP